MEYADYLTTLRLENPVIGATVEAFRTLDNVLDWMRREGLPLESLNWVTQDAYCQDLVVPLADGRFLAFGMTRQGALTAVAVWTGRPSAEQLLARRIAEGWRPISKPLSPVLGGEGLG